MKYCHTNDEIDEIGEGLVRQFNFDSYSKGQAVDIEKFITEYLKYQIVYDNIAEEDAGKTAFLGDGKACKKRSPSATCTENRATP